MVDWSFVIKHYDTIDRHCKSFVKGMPIVLEDLKQAAYLDIATHCHKYDKKKAGPSTFIWMRVRKARETLLRDVNKSNRVKHAVNVMPFVKCSWLPEDLVDAQAVIQDSTTRETEAIRSVVESWSQAEVRARLACSVSTRSNLIARIRERTL